MSSRRFALLVAVVLFAAGLRQGWSFRPLDVGIAADDQLYFYVAERVASGEPPHVSLVDHKHQLAPLLCGAAIAAGRLIGADDVHAGRVPSLLAAAALPALLFALARRLTGSTAAGVLAGVTALTLRTVYAEAAVGFRPQLFMMFFATSALLAYAYAKRAIAGVLAAGAFLCWQPAVVVGVGLLIAAAFETRSRSAVLRVAAGGVAALVVYEAYFAAHGALAEQLRQSYLMAAQGGRRERPLSNALMFIVRGDPKPLQWVPDHVFAAVLLVIAAVGAVWAVAFPGRARRLWCRDGGWRAVVLSAAGAIAFTCVDHQAFPDRFFVEPFVALAAGVVPWLAIGRAGPAPVWRVAVAGLLLWTTAAAAAVGPGRRPAPTLAEQREMAHRLTALADTHGGSLWVIGRPDLLAHVGRRNFSPYGMLLDSRVREYARRRMRTPYVRPVHRGKTPNVIVVSRLGSSRPISWIRASAEYEPVVIEGPGHRLRAWVRKPELLSPTGPPPVSTCGDPIGDRFSVAGADVGRPATATDALYVLRGALKRGACDLCVCDVDGSGRLNVSDALRMLKLAAGEHVELRCPPCAAPLQRRARASLPYIEPRPRRRAPARGAKPPSVVRAARVR